MKYGRQARRFDPRVPHLSALLAGQKLPSPPAAIDWTSGMPADLGVMLNDTLGDCTCAAWGHAVQVWTFNSTGTMQTLPDDLIESLYEKAAGYVPGDSATDQGADEQTVLTYLLKTGLGGNQLAAFVEIDPRNTDDIRRAIAWGGLVYIGFNVPGFLQNLESPGSVWHVDPTGDNSIVGGHAVILPGYDETGFDVISWGSKYKMGFGFFGDFVDEVYALVDAEWITAKGESPGGLTLELLEKQMQALRGTA